ncbi:putative AfsR-like regulator [Streptomyces scabiei 87.22]|uniref:Putative AfsR-like regulator n=11 Tax=Streptomyces TaxID=1883 RepID=C9Z6X7_STRSW|nr:regulator [Streptomyces scabiei]CBG69917.1 putative AfsR-like regulator [Streptomyces scabiei 87.22]
MGGIGKTALVVEAAHRAWAKSWFPGGFLFVDLRGYDDNPVTADQGVLALLDAMGVRGTDLPPTAARQYDAYRALLTERRDRTLLILDNASDPSQYLPLLPGTDHHRVVITSRDRPDSLPIRVIDLETLDPDESVALITHALHYADERDDRPSREPSVLRELVALCGHLPLALQIAAAMLRRRRHRQIASLLEDIRETGDPTATLDSGSPGTDLHSQSLALRPVLETSYRRLPPDQARLLRLLCLAPGADTGTEAVAAMTALDKKTASSLLESLAAAYLVTPVRGDQGTAAVLRWRLHDLVRVFGVGVVAGDAGLWEEGKVAQERLLMFYNEWATAADERLQWWPGRAEPERFADRREALAWFDQERAGLVEAALWAREERFASTAIRLADCLPDYLDWRRYFDDKIAVTRAAQEAAHRAGDSLNEAVAWNNHGTALRDADRVEEAIDALTHARDLHQNRRDPRREADTWNNLGLALRDAGQIAEAIDALTHARDLHQSTENRRGEATAWNNIGAALQEAGRMEEAIDAHIRARDLHQSTENRRGEAMAWNNIGAALGKSGQPEEAITAFGKDLEICRELEDWYGVGQSLGNLALALLAAHRPAEARAHWLRACDAYTRANAPAEATQARARASVSG